MKKNILLIVQNNSFPFDKRVFREANTLINNNYNVFVISPSSSHDPYKNDIVNGITVTRYNDIPAKGGVLSYIFEYINAFLKIYFLSVKLIITKKISIIHVANPPDFFWLLASFIKIFGVKFIYDQHDLAPEMSKSKFNNTFIYSLLLLFEKLSVKFADHIIVVNHVFKERLITKWRIKPEKCSVVYNGPTEDFYPIVNNELIDHYKSKKVVLYVGLMTINDHIEIIIEAANYLINKNDRKDLFFILVGDGDVRIQMESLVLKYQLNNYIKFTGIVDHNKVKEYIHIANVCIAPDLPNGLNENLTLVKVLEYMKCSKGFVSFNLKETMHFAGEAGLYAVDLIDFAQKILLLVDNPILEKEMGKKGNKIITDNYLWKHSEIKLLNAYSITQNS